MEEEGPELRPEVKTAQVIEAEHGGVALKPVEPLAGVGIAADHACHFQIEAFKGRKLQQKAAHGQVEAVVNGCLEIQKDCAERLRDDLGFERFPAGHELRCDDHAQRVADGLLENAVQLRIRHGYAEGAEGLLDIPASKEQLISAEHRHQSHILKGHQTARRHAA